MPILNCEADEILKKTRIRYGLCPSNPIRIDSGYDHIDIFSERLPITTNKEYDIAERVAKEHNLDLLYQDFGLGEGLQHNFEYIFSITCTSSDELKNASMKMASIISKLKEEIEKIRH